ncbi:MAG: hypothetical protein ACXWL2_04730 [Candidatus Chromulinivorax sp.]
MTLFFIGVFLFFKKYSSDMTIIYPDDCIFVIDHFFSKTKQLEIKKFIDTAYKKNKIPSKILPVIERHFPEIKAIVVDMQNPQEVKFSIRAYHPYFLLNNDQVVCQFGKLFPQSFFAPDQLANLENIEFSGKISTKNIERLMHFFEKLTGVSDKVYTTSFVLTPKIQGILQNFSIRWVDKYAIWLDLKQSKKQGKDIALLVSYDHVPTEEQVAECQSLREQIVDKSCDNKKSKKCASSKQWVCDLRFDQQIVLFSKN